MPGIRRDSEHRLCRGREQKIVDHRLVVVGDVADRRRQREDDMEIGHREQLGLARGHPFARGRALALGTVPVAAAVVGDHCMGAVLAACHMAAEGGRTAALDGAHHLELVEAHVAAVGIAPCGPVAAEDVRDFQTWPGHAGGLRRRSGVCGTSPPAAEMPGSKVHDLIDDASHSVLTQHNDSERTGAYLVETQLTSIGPHLHGAPTYWEVSPANGLVFHWSEKDYLKRFDHDRLGSGLLAPASVLLGDVRAEGMDHGGNWVMPGGLISLSANGTHGGILWITLPWGNGG